jgi:hypothetical protein
VLQGTGEILILVLTSQQQAFFESYLLLREDAYASDYCIRFTFLIIAWAIGGQLGAKRLWVDQPRRHRTLRAIPQREQITADRNRAAIQKNAHEFVRK